MARATKSPGFISLPRYNPCDGESCPARAGPARTAHWRPRGRRGSCWAPGACADERLRRGSLFGEIQRSEKTYRHRRVLPGGSGIGHNKEHFPPPDFGSAHEFGVRSGDATRLEGRAIATGSPNTPHEARARVTPTAAGHEAVASRSTVGSAPNSSSNPRRGGGAASGPARWFGTIRWREGVGWGGL